MPKERGIRPLRMKLTLQVLESSFLLKERKAFLNETYSIGVSRLTIDLQSTRKMFPR
jgi:hypothetical protein